MSSRKNFSDNSWSNWVLITLAAITCFGAILRVFPPNEDIQKRLDEKTLFYIGAAGVLLLLRDVKNIAFGDWKVEFFEKKVEEAKAAAAVATDAVKYRLAGGGEESSNTQFTVSEIQPGTNINDPWKGQFGRKSLDKYCEMTATVIPASDSSEWFYVTLRVQSTAPTCYPLKGRVQFYLHPTFANTKPIVPVVKGLAELNFRAWGAFTVGAVIEKGTTEEVTKLEFDLAEAFKNVPELRSFVGR